MHGIPVLQRDHIMHPVGKGTGSFLHILDKKDDMIARTYSQSFDIMVEILTLLGIDVYYGEGSFAEQKSIDFQNLVHAGERTKKKQDRLAKN